jgi:hypothetical protein
VARSYARLELRVFFGTLSRLFAVANIYRLRSVGKGHSVLGIRKGCFPPGTVQQLASISFPGIPAARYSIGLRHFSQSLPGLTMQDPGMAWQNHSSA